MQFLLGSWADGALFAHRVNVTLNFKYTNTRENTPKIPYFPRKQYLPNFRYRYFATYTIHAECMLITVLFHLHRHKVEMMQICGNIKQYISNCIMDTKELFLKMNMYNEQCIHSKNSFTCNYLLAVIVILQVSK